MKGKSALIIAVGLGIAGALLNWAYLNKKAAEAANVYFIGIQPGSTVNRGEKLTEADIVPVAVPKDWAGNMKEFLVPWDARASMVDRPIWRTIPGGSLLLDQDKRAVLQSLEFGGPWTPSPTNPGQLEEPPERALWIPVDTRTFVPSLVAPGDQVSFVVPNAPTRFDPSNPNPLDSTTAGPTKLLGPFTVLALGNRVTDAETMKTSGIPVVQENVMCVLVTQINGKLDAQAQQLVDILAATNFRQIGVLRHPRRP